MEVSGIGATPTPRYAEPAPPPEPPPAPPPPPEEPPPPPEDSGRGQNVDTSA
jgi:hypothetical protein